MWEGSKVRQRRRWHPTPVLLPGKSHGWRSLVGCSPWGCEESDMTERLHFHFSLSCIGEGNGNPLQCSCLENPRDGGTWWAAVYGVVQRRTQLKQLSSSSSSIPTPSPHPVCRKIIFHKTSLWCQKSWGLLIHSFTGRNKPKFLLFGIHSLANTTSSTK